RCSMVKRASRGTALTTLPTPQGGSIPRAQVAPDVFLKGAALEFSRQAGPMPRERRIDAAKLLLEALRGDTEGMTFGSRVRNNIDGAQSLRSYYRALDVANTLASALPECEEAIETFLARISAPEDLHDMVHAAALEEPGAIEGGGGRIVGRAIGDVAV